MEMKALVPEYMAAIMIIGTFIIIYVFSSHITGTEIKQTSWRVVLLLIGHHGKHLPSLPGIN